MICDMKSENIIKEYPYLYDMHLHTNVGSACGKASPEDMAIACKEYGYTGIVVTDHNWGWNTCIDEWLLIKDFDKWIDAYAMGYYRAKKVGDEIGLDVFFGMEAGFNATEFLIYGLTPEYFKEHPEFRDAKISEWIDLVHKGGGIVSHAHPFREEAYIPEVRLFPDYVDAVEGVNATHTGDKSDHRINPMFDIKAREYARKHGLPMTAGTDVHKTDLIGGGIRTKNKIMGNEDLVNLIKSGSDYVLYDTKAYYLPR